MMTDEERKRCEIAVYLALRYQPSSKAYCEFATWLLGVERYWVHIEPRLRALLDHNFFVTIQNYYFERDGCYASTVFKIWLACELANNHLSCESQQKVAKWIQNSVNSATQVGSVSTSVQENSNSTDLPQSVIPEQKTRKVLLDSATLSALESKISLKGKIYNK